MINRSLSIKSTLTLTGFTLNGATKTPDDRYVFIAAGGSLGAYVIRIDVESKDIQYYNFAPSPSWGGDVAFKPGGDPYNPMKGAKLYVSEPYLGKIYVLDPNNGETLEGINTLLPPERLDIHPFTWDKLYISSFSGFGCISNGEFQTLSTNSTLDVIFHPSGEMAYLIESDKLRIINPEDNSEVQTISISNVKALSIDPEGTKLYIGKSSGNQLTVLNLEPPISIDSISVATSPYRVAFLLKKIGFIQPQVSPKEGGIEVIIYGQNFLEDVQVKLDGSLVLTEYISPGVIKFISPPKGPGSYPLVVINPDGEWDEVSFHYAEPTLRRISLPSGIYVEDYRMLSMPLFTAGTFLAYALESGLGPYDPTVWRVFRWDSLLGGYIEYQEYLSLLEKKVIPQDITGTAFWIIVRDGGSITIAGLESMDISNTSGIYILLEPG